MTTTPAKTNGIHHLGLTVPNLAQAREFFVDALGFSQVGEKPNYPAVFVSDGAVMITLWQANEGATAFDRHTNIGLHHFALEVPGHEALEALHEAFALREDVVVEFAPEPLGTAGARHLMSRIPGNIRLELIAPHA